MWSDVRGCRRVGADAARPRRDDGRCLIVLDHGGSRRHVMATTALSRRPLRELLEAVANPGDRRGACHPLVSVLCLAVVGVLAGCRTPEAMREHVADPGPDDSGVWVWRRGGPARRVHSWRIHPHRLPAPPAHIREDHHRRPLHSTPSKPPSE